MNGRERPRILRAVLAAAVLLACAAPSLLALDLSVRSGCPGQSFSAKITTRPLPASGATLQFSGSGVTASDLGNDEAGFLTFRISIAPGAALGTYGLTYTRGGVIQNPNAFLVVACAPPPPPPPPPTPSPTVPPAEAPTPVTPTPRPPEPSPSPSPETTPKPPEAGPSPAPSPEVTPAPAGPASPPPAAPPFQPTGWLTVPMPPEPPPPGTRERTPSPPGTQERKTPPPSETPPTPPSHGGGSPPTIYGEEFAGLPLDIHPIQVVQEPFHEAIPENVALVQDKKTMVRVFPLLPPNRQRIDNVKGCLKWNNEPEECIVATLIRYQGRIWVLPNDIFVAPDPTTTSEGQNILNWMAGNPNRPEQLAKRQDRYWAYNFTYGTGKTVTNFLVLAARLEILGATVATARELAPRDFKLKPFQWGNGTFQVAVSAYSATGALKTFTPPTVQNVFGALARQGLKYVNQILAVFPIPENKITLAIDLRLDPARPGMALVDAGPNIERVAGGGGNAKTLEQRFPTADTILVVSPDKFKVGQGMLGGLGLGPVEGWTPGNTERVHYVEESSTGNDSLVAAHETGHDKRFFGAPHPARQEVEDAWDVGARAHPRSETARGRGQLMSAAKEAQKRNDAWISVEEYRKLQDLMLAGGRDPVLVSFSGIIGRSGKLELPSPWLLLGAEPAVSAGDGVLQFLDGAGREIGHWSFSIERLEGLAEKGFHFLAPVPGETRKMVFRLPGGIQREFGVSEAAPWIEWRDVRLENDGSLLRARLTVSHRAGEAIRAQFVYSPDGNSRIDVSGSKNGEEHVFFIGHLPGGREARLCVRAEAGLRLTEGCSPPFAVPDRKPLVFIEEQTGEDGDRRLSALVFDPEDRLDVRVRWSSGGSPLGEGPSPDPGRLAKLPRRTHRLRATARDSAGQETSAETEIRIR